MKRRELSLASSVYRANQTAAHERPLKGGYGYNSILGEDLPRLCVEALGRERRTIRVLDVGCGSGLGMHQLEQELERRGLGGRVEIFGMGLNWYDRMHISPRRFRLSGLFHSSAGDPAYDLVVSVFAFHYLWHKLEGVEKIHNRLLADRGRAVLHFPGYLAELPGSPEGAGSEEAGNRAFSALLERVHRRGGPRLRYDQVPYLSEDDDCALLNEFGRLSFTRAAQAELDFGLELESFGVVPADFEYEHASVSKPQYVRSRYRERDRAPSAAAPVGDEEGPDGRASYRVTLPARRLGLGPIELEVRPLLSRPVLVLLPGSGEGLDDGALPFPFIAENAREAGLGAVLRADNPVAAAGEAEELEVRLSRMLDYARVHARRICGIPDPEFSLMGYSSGASALAAFASAHADVKRLLLVAPSLDVPREVILPGLSAFGGELYIVAAARDEIVMPSQSRWFYRTARAASRKRFVEIAHCGHAFAGEYNQALIRHCPHWAFGGSRDFPPAEMSRG